MTFQEADAKLTELVGAGRYRQLTYGLTRCPDGRTEVECVIFADGGILERGATWAAAFAKAERFLNPQQPDASEAPGEEGTSKETP